MVAFVVLLILLALLEAPCAAFRVRISLPRLGALEMGKMGMGKKRKMGLGDNTRANIIAIEDRNSELWKTEKAIEILLEGK